MLFLTLLLTAILGMFFPALIYAFLARKQLPRTILFLICSLGTFLAVGVGYCFYLQFVV